MLLGMRGSQMCVQVVYFHLRKVQWHLVCEIMEQGSVTLSPTSGMEEEVTFPVLGGPVICKICHANDGDEGELVESDKMQESPFQARQSEPEPFHDKRLWAALDLALCYAGAAA
jgi:hypothetical protein